MKRSGLTQLEDLVQEMIEGTFGRLFGGRLEPQDVANHLVRAIEDNEASGGSATRYEVLLNPEDLQALDASTANLPAQLADAAYDLGRRIGINGSIKPEIQLRADARLKRRGLRIHAITDARPTGSEQATRAYRQAAQRDTTMRSLRQLDAYLIVQGRKHIALDRPILSLGRRTENDIVLDVPSVSRQHAQIRWRFGNFVLYDISSRGSTLVNGYATREHVLRSGDVIALGEALLVYAEGAEERPSTKSSDSSEDTQIHPPGSA